MTSKFGLSSATCVLCVWFCGQTAATETILLLDNKLFSFEDFLFAFGMELLLLFTLFVHLDLALALNIGFLLIHLFCFALDLNDTEVASHSCLDNEVIFLGSGTVGIVNDEAS